MTVRIRDGDHDQEGGFISRPHPTGRTEQVSQHYPELVNPGDVTDMDSLRHFDPPMYKNVQEVISALKLDMLPPNVAKELVLAMPPTLQRELVAKISGLEASVLLTFKNQLMLIDAVLKRVVNSDGTPVNQQDRDALGISVKDAMNLSLKVTQALVRELPKIYTVERIQRQERAMNMVIERHFDRPAQLKMLEALENYEQMLEAEGGVQ